MDQEDLDRRLLEVSSKERSRENGHEIHRLIEAGADMKSYGGRPLLELARNKYTYLAEEYIYSGDFSKYMSSGNRVRMLVQGLYEIEHGEPMIFMHVVFADDRDKAHSVSYLWALRQAISEVVYAPRRHIVFSSQVEDMSKRETEGTLEAARIAKMLLENINYPVDLLADVIDVDSKSIFPQRYPLWRDDAYILTLHDIKKKDAAFFEMYMLYRTIVSSSDNELVMNLMALDNPRVLWYMADLESHADAVNRYYNWKYQSSTAKNDPHDSEIIREISNARGNNSTLKRLKQLFLGKTSWESVVPDLLKAGVSLSGDRIDNTTLENAVQLLSNRSEEKYLQ